eukprot:scaffold24_cov341-Pavlova_lutheri.AAC.18
MTPTTKSVGAGCARAFSVLDWLHGCTQARVLQRFPVCIISVFLVAGGSVSSARPGCVGSSLLKFPVDSSPRPALGGVALVSYSYVMETMDSRSDGHPPDTRSCWAFHLPYQTRVPFPTAPERPSGPDGFATMRPRAFEESMEVWLPSREDGCALP